MTYQEIKTLLEKNGQSQLLKFWDRLNTSQQTSLLEQITSLDFKSIEKMKAMLANKDKVQPATSEIQPAAVIKQAEIDLTKMASEGEYALRSGKVGVLLVAGGQGSRLGFDGPKGCYKIGPISGASLFEIHSRKILALEQKYEAEVPFYIMTSSANDNATKEFFEENHYFGLSKDRVKFFKQGMWPALWEDGKIVLEAHDKLFMGPDGHGGILSALESNGMLKDMQERKLETLFYFQVDNPLVEIADPAFIGVHRNEEADISVKVCAKRDASEGIGVVVIKNGRNAVVEYTELTDKQKNAKNDDGSLRFLFGSVAIHVFSLDFLIKEAASDLPLHLAHKKVPFCDDNGNTIKPDTPNAYKFEKFIFDAIPDADKTVNLEFFREDEFSPVKNAEGNDSPAMTKRDMVRKFARWFQTIGVEVPLGSDGEPEFKIEIDPCYALNPQDLAKKIGKDFKIKEDTLLTSC